MQEGEINMGHSKFFWKSVIYGAIAGGALSLLKKETRHAIMNDCKKTAKNISYIVKHPDEVADQLKQVTSKVRASVEEISEDVSYITEKVAELREATPQVTEMVKNTKEAFKKNGQA
jgi:methyl-accepting chemotaxis protein